MSIRDDFWLWGQMPNSHHEEANNIYNLPGVNRMTPSEGAEFFGIKNVSVSKSRERFVLGRIWGRILLFLNTCIIFNTGNGEWNTERKSKLGFIAPGAEKNRCGKCWTRWRKPKKESSDLRAVQWRYPLGMPTVRHLSSGIFEIRSVLPNRISRILFVYFDEKIVLLHGFIKKTRQTPRQDLETALKRFEDLKNEEK